MRGFITERQQQAKEKFDELSEEQSRIRKRLADIEPELYRLQGEYKAYETLLDTETSPVEGEVVDVANTIIVEETEDA